jgi:hypothetical protein
MTTRPQVHSDQRSKPSPDIARDVTGEFGLSLSRLSIVACGTAHFAGQIGKLDRTVREVPRKIGCLSGNGS